MIFADGNLGDRSQEPALTEEAPENVSSNAHDENL